MVKPAGKQLAVNSKNTLLDLQQVNNRQNQTTPLDKIITVLSYPLQKWEAAKGVITTPIAEHTVKLASKIPIGGDWHQKRCQDIAAKSAKKFLASSKIPVAKIEHAIKKVIRISIQFICSLKPVATVLAEVKKLYKNETVAKFADSLNASDNKIAQFIGRNLAKLQELPQTIEQINLEDMLANRVFYPLILSLERKAAEAAVQSGLSMAIDTGIIWACGGFGLAGGVSQIFEGMSQASTVASGAQIAGLTYVAGKPVYNVTKLVYQGYAFKKELKKIEEVLSKVNLQPIIDKLQLSSLPKAYVEHAIRAVMVIMLESGAYSMLAGPVDLQETLEKPEKLIAFLNKLSQTIGNLT